MKNFRKILLAAFIMIILLVLPVLSFAEKNPLTIVFCNDGHTNPYHVEWLAGFESAVKAYNKEFGNIEGYWRSATRFEVQMEQVQEEIEKGVEILFVNAINVEAFKPLVRKAQEKGIIWISVHNYMDVADYNFILGDIDNGYRQGLALATYFGGKAKVAIMLGKQGMISGDERQQGILKAFQKYPNIKVVAQEPADWDTVKALKVSEKWFSKYPDLDALSVVTDSYLYPAMQIAQTMDLNKIAYFGYDGDKDILKRMKNPGTVKADILLSATREGWNFVQMAYKIANNMPVEKTYDFYTPLVLSKETYEICLKNGFPTDIEVFTVDKALELAEKGFREFGTDSVK